MSTLAESHIEMKKPWLWLAVGGVILLVWGAIAFRTMRESPVPVHTQRVEQSADLNTYAAAMSKPVAVAQVSEGRARAIAEPLASPAAPLAGADRKIIRTSSLELIVLHPADVADKLKALERENRELRQANEILRKASAYFAQAELDRPFRR